MNHTTFYWGEFCKTGTLGMSWKTDYKINMTLIISFSVHGNVAYIIFTHVIASRRTNPSRGGCSLQKYILYQKYTCNASIIELTLFFLSLSVLNICLEWLRQYQWGGRQIIHSYKWVSFIPDKFKYCKNNQSWFGCLLRVLINFKKKS